MASLTRRLSSLMLATAMVGALVIEPAFAQVTPGAPTVGPAGGVSSTSAPSNSEGTPSGGTGNLGGNRIVLNPQQGAMEQAPMTAAPRRTRATRRAAARRNRAARMSRTRMAPATMGTGAASSSGLNGSNAPSAPAAR